jgi:hypothetical protein
MEQQLTSAERRLIERELIAREEVQAKRRKYFRFLFVVGLTSSVIAAFCRAFRIGGILPALLGVGSLVCVLLYSEFLTVPRTFSQDMSPGWHLNPWQEALQRMGADGRLIQGIIMLAIYPVSLMLFSFVSLGFGSR